MQAGPVIMGVPARWSMVVIAPALGPARMGPMGMAMIMAVGMVMPMGMGRGCHTPNIPYGRKGIPYRRGRKRESGPDFPGERV